MGDSSSEQGMSVAGAPRDASPGESDEWPILSVLLTLVAIGFFIGAVIAAVMGGLSSGFLGDDVRPEDVGRMKTGYGLVVFSVVGLQALLGVGAAHGARRSARAEPFGRFWGASILWVGAGFVITFAAGIAVGSGYPGAPFAPNANPGAVVVALVVAATLVALGVALVLAGRHGRNSGSSDGSGSVGRARFDRRAFE